MELRKTVLVLSLVFSFASLAEERHSLVIVGPGEGGQEKTRYSCEKNGYQPPTKNISVAETTRVGKAKLSCNNQKIFVTIE